MTLAITLSPMFSIGLGLVMGGAGLGIAYFVWRSTQRRFIATHGPTFQRLCDGLGVTRLERWRLKRLAGKAGLMSPTVLLISRGAFENALVRGAVHPDTRWAQSFRARIFTGE